MWQSPYCDNLFIATILAINSCVCLQELYCRAKLYLGKDLKILWAKEMDKSISFLFSLDEAMQL